MKKITLPGVSLALLIGLTTLPTHAAAADGPKAKLFAKYDTNKNGVIDGDEIAALRKDFAADPKGELARFDTNHDGQLDDAEIAAIKPPGGGAKKGGEKKAKKSSTTDADASAAPTPTPATPAK